MERQEFIRFWPNGDQGGAKMKFDIPELLDRLGYPIAIRGENCVVSSAYRNGDNPLAVFVNSSGICYDQVQGRTFKLVEFVAEFLGVTITEAQKFINSNQSATIEVKEPKIALTPRFDTKDIENLTDSFKFYLDRNISRDTLETFECGLAHSGRFYGRIVFPIPSKRGLIGAAGRDVLGRNTPKWKICGPKKLFLYPIHLSSKYIQKTKQIILVESIGDALRLWEFGIKNIVVLFGLSLSKELLIALLSQNPSQILLGLNNDSDKEKNRGQIGAIRVREKLREFFSDSQIIDAPPTKGDFGELSDEKMREWSVKYKVENFK